MDYRMLADQVTKRVAADVACEREMSEAAQKVAQAMCSQLGINRHDGWLENERRRVFVQLAARSADGKFHDLGADADLAKFIDVDTMRLDAAIRIRFQSGSSGKPELMAAFSVSMKAGKPQYHVSDVRTADLVTKVFSTPGEIAQALLAHIEEALKYDPATGPTEIPPIGFIRSR